MIQYAARSVYRYFGFQNVFCEGIDVTAIDTPSRRPYVSAVAQRQNDIIRAAIMAEYERRKLNPYRLWKLVEGKVSRTTVYTFVAGDSTLSTENATHFLEAMGITVRRPPK